jgi:cysteine desulfurase family protein (TIGR01976 family)
MLDVDALRAEFPALTGTQVYLDAPAGTQVPNVVIRAITEALSSSMSNVGGGFESSRRSEAVVAAARVAASDLVQGAAEEIVFGPNMTTLTFAVSRAISETWRPGDRVVVSALDHDANITPWVRAAQVSGLQIEFVSFDPVTTAIDLEHLRSVVDERTRLIAITACSNAFGTLVDIAAVASIAHAVGALTFIDAVHLAPHRRLDVVGWDVDFLVCSSYKFFGPHLGILWGKAPLLESLPAFKVRPAPDGGPSRWETGTPSFELLAGFEASVGYLASVGWGGDRRGALDFAFTEIEERERMLGARFLAGLEERARVIGQPTMEGRVPTFSLVVDGCSPQEVADEFGRRGLAVWAGHHYAVEPMSRLGLVEGGGTTRIGFTHLTTEDEVDRASGVLKGLSSRP